MTAMSTCTMRAYALTGPREGEVQEVPASVAAPGEVVVDVERVGVCGTDVEFFTGHMAYFHEEYASYAMRLGMSGGHGCERRDKGGPGVRRSPGYGRSLGGALK
jgi:Alcohol dehydrogenase GroES-like domain